MAEQKIYVSKANLVYYDEKLKAWVVNQDLATLTAAKNYADGKDTAIAEAKAAADAAQETANSGVSKADAAQAGVDSINSKIGTVEDGKTVMGIIQNIQENAYDDTEIQAKVSKNTEDIAGLDTRLTAEEGKVSTLIGDDAGKSVRAITLEEVAKILNDNDDTDVDTLEEIAAWIKAHPDSVAEINARIEQNATAIDALTALVGEMPEGEASATIVAYIQKLVAAEETRAKGVEEDLDDRLTSLETKMGDSDSTVEEQITSAVESALTTAAADATAKANQALADSKEYTGTEVKKVDDKATQNATDITALQEKDEEIAEDIANLQTAVNTTLPESIAAAKKAGDDAQADVDALTETVSTLSGKVDTNTENIAQNASDISSHAARLDALEAVEYVELTTAEIDELFA